MMKIEPRTTTPTNHHEPGSAYSELLGAYAAEAGIGDVVAATATEQEHAQPHDGVVDVPSERTEAAAAAATCSASASNSGDELPALRAQRPLLGYLDATAMPVPAEPATEAIEAGYAVAASSGRRPWGWAPSGRRVPLDSTRLYLPSQPRFKTALRAANQLDRSRWLRTSLNRIAGLGLLALALFVGLGILGCASRQDQGGLYWEYVPTGGGAPPATGSQSNHFAGPATRNDTVHGLADPGNHSGAVADEPLVVEGGGSDEFESHRREADHGRTHIVERGETLFSLAREYYGEAARWRDIAEANNLTRESTIYVGQELLIPGEAATGAEGVPASHSSADTGPSNLHARTPLGQAQYLVEQGRLRDARHVLSSHLYELGGHDDEVAALHLLSRINMELLGDTGPDGDCLVHVVERGENLYRISRHYGCTWQSIVKLNRLRDTRIFPGQELRILKGTPQLVINAERGFVDLWLDEHFIKRYAVVIETNSYAPGRDSIKRKRDNPGNGLGPRALELDSGLTLHGGSATSGIAFEADEIDELYDIVLVGTNVTRR